MAIRRILLGSLVGVAAVPLLIAAEGVPARADGSALVARAADAQAEASLNLRIVTDEPEAVLAIARKKKAGEAIGEDDWQRLFATEGYARLKKRETSMGRSFEDEAFKTFVLSEKTLAAADTYAAQLVKWKALDAKAAAALALKYLPAGTALRGSIYPSIKPRENSFVFELATNPAIFFYMNAADPQPVSENVLAHELHHVGTAAACDAPTVKKIGAYPERKRLVARLVGAFSEGLAMVAAAGGPDVHPHAASTAEIKAGWDRDVANFDQDLRKVEAFFLDILEGRLTDQAEIQKRQMAFFGFQGPWYTVGWRMAVTIERAYGHDAVVGSFCDWTRLLQTYNRAATEANAKGGPQLATWSPKLLEAISE